MGLANAEAPRPIAGGKRMPEKSMKEKLAAAELVLCMNLRLARSVDIAMVAKAGGYDALYVDMQHAPYSIETTATICAAALGIGITPLVRVPNHDAQWDEPGARRRCSGRHPSRCQHQRSGRGDRQRLPLSTAGKTLGDGIGTGAWLPLGAAIRAEPKAQRGDGGHRHDRDRGGYRELRCHRRGRWDRCPVDRLR